MRVAGGLVYRLERQARLRFQLSATMTTGTVTDIMLDSHGGAAEQRSGGAACSSVVCQLKSKRSECCIQIDTAKLANKQHADRNHGFNLFWAKGQDPEESPKKKGRLLKSKAFIRPRVRGNIYAKRSGRCGPSV